MKKIIKEFTIYEYNELSKEMKDKILQEEINAQLNLYTESTLKDEMEWQAIKLLDMNQIQFYDLKIYYDLSYCQGSGAMMEFETNILKLDEKYKLLNEEELTFIESNGFTDTIHIVHNDICRYYHENSFDIKTRDFDYEPLDEKYEKIQNSINNKQDRMLDMLYEELQVIYKEFGNIGYELINTDNFEDIALEYVNNQLYYEDGSYYGEKE